MLLLSLTPYFELIYVLCAFDIVHVVYGIFASPIWKKEKIKKLRKCQRLRQTLRHWLLINLRGNTNWNSIFAHAVYFLWLARNKEIFYHVTPSSEELYHSFGSFYSSYQVPSSLAAHIRERHTIFVGWLPPNDGWIKLNSDGFVSANGRASSGGLAGTLQGDICMVLLLFWGLARSQ